MTYDEFLDAFRRVCEDENSLEDLAILTDPENFYFNVYSDEDNGTIAIVTPKCLWDEEETVCDQSTANILVHDSLNGSELMESVYEFDEENPGLLKNYLSEQGLEHNPDIKYPY